MSKDGETVIAQLTNTYYEGGVHFMWDDFAEFYVFANDPQHAAKIANEKRGQLIATGKWETPERPPWITR